MKVTQKQLNIMADRLNDITGHNKEVCIDRVWQIGAYYISGAYGGYSLHQIKNTAGGVSDVFNSGHVSASELYSMINAYICGIYDTKEAI